MHTMKQLLLILVMMMTMSACGVMSAISENESEAKLITMYATIKVIKGDEARASKVAEIAEKVREYASNAELLTIDLLIGEIRTHVPWDRMDAADELLVNALVDELRDRLAERYGIDPLPADLKLAATTVADWIIAAARMTQRSS